MHSYTEIHQTHQHDNTSASDFVIIPMLFGSFDPENKFLDDEKAKTNRGDLTNMSAEKKTIGQHADYH